MSRSSIARTHNRTRYGCHPESRSQANAVRAKTACYALGRYGAGRLVRRAGSCRQILWIFNTEGEQLAPPAIAGADGCWIAEGTQSFQAISEAGGFGDARVVFRQEQFLSVQYRRVAPGGEINVAGDSPFEVTRQGGQ